MTLLLLNYTSTVNRTILNDYFRRQCDTTPQSLKPQSSPPPSPPFLVWIKCLSSVIVNPGHLHYNFILWPVEGWPLSSLGRPVKTFNGNRVSNENKNWIDLVLKQFYYVNIMYNYSLRNKNSCRAQISILRTTSLQDFWAM